MLGWVKLGKANPMVDIINIINLLLININLTLVNIAAQFTDTTRLLNFLLAHFTA